MPRFFKPRSTKTNAINHRIAEQLWAEIVKIKGLPYGSIPVSMSASPRGIQLSERHQAEGMSVYIRELDGPHRILAYPVKHSDLRANLTSETRVDWDTLAKIVVGGSIIILSGDSIRIENSTVDVSQALQNPGYLKMVAAQSVVTAQFGPLFREPGKLSEDDFRAFLAFENNHHWTGLHRQAPNLLAQGMDHLRETISILTKEKRSISSRYDSAIERQNGLGRGIATAILLVAYPDQYGVWNATSEKGLTELGKWPEMPRGSSEGERYEAINAVLNDLAVTLDVDLWSLDGLLHFITHPEAGIPLSTDPVHNSTVDQLGEDVFDSMPDEFWQPPRRPVRSVNEPPRINQPI